MKKDNKIRLGFFYYDLCNLYGDSGNVMILVHHLEAQGAKVIVDRLTVDEPKKIEKYDWIYMGSATDRGLLLALMDLRKYKTALAYAIEHGTHILATGNSFELFGKELRMGSKLYHGLGLLDFSTKYGPRIVNDLMEPYIGFENHPGVTVESKEAPFVDLDDRKEGVVRNNFIGTYTVGPLLVRNPAFLRSYVEAILRKKDPDFEIKPMDLHLEQAVYEASVEELSKPHVTY